MSATRGEVVVTGGGTAGHVLPALAVARALLDGGRAPAEVHYVGAARGMEATLVPETGLALTLLPGRGIERRLSRRSVEAVAALVSACAQAFVLLARKRPAVVVSVGGYAAVPCSLAALLLRVPVVVVNVDAVPGAANRLVGRFARASAVALPGTPLPRAVLTGAPVRPEVLAVDRTEAGRATARKTLALDPDRLVVGVTGGSLGARRLNDAAIGLAHLWAKRGDLTLYQVCGEREYERVLAACPGQTGGPGVLEHRIVPYERRLPELLAAADVLICRAGASTIAECTVVGTPSLLVPLPNAPGDHQRRNAERLQEAGAALLVLDDAASPEHLAEVLEPLLADGALRQAMGEAARRLGRPDAASRVAALVEEVAGSPKRVRNRRPGRAR